MPFQNFYLRLFMGFEVHQISSWLHTVNDVFSQRLIEQFPDWPSGVKSELRERKPLLFTELLLVVLQLFTNTSAADFSSGAKPRSHIAGSCQTGSCYGCSDCYS